MKTIMEMLAIVSAVTEVKIERITLTGSRRYGQFIGSQEPMEYDGRDVDVVIEWNGTPTEFDARVTNSFVGASLVTNYVHYTPDHRREIVDPDGHVVAMEVIEAYENVGVSTVCAYGVIDGYTVNFIVLPPRQWEIWRFITDVFCAQWSAFSKLSKPEYKNIFIKLRKGLESEASIFAGK